MVQHTGPSQPLGRFGELGRSKSSFIRLPRRHATAALFDYLVGTQQKRCRDRYAQGVRGSHVEHRLDMRSRSSDIRLIRLSRLHGEVDGDAGRKQSEPVSTSVLIVPGPGVEQRRPVH